MPKRLVVIGQMLIDCFILRSHIMTIKVFEHSIDYVRDVVKKYDDQGRCIERIYRGKGFPDGGFKIQIEYDEDGKWAKATYSDDAGFELYEYDDQGKCIKITHHDGSWIIYEYHADKVFEIYSDGVCWRHDKDYTPLWKP
jgi:YD repeat-containing protein